MLRSKCLVQVAEASLAFVHRSEEHLAIKSGNSAITECAAAAGHQPPFSALHVRFDDQIAGRPLCGAPVVEGSRAHFNPPEMFRQFGLAASRVFEKRVRFIEAVEEKG